MATTGGTSHSQSVSLSDNLTRTYYVRCSADNGNSYSSEVSTIIYIKAATPAAPTLSPADGDSVNNGTTTITVTSSGAACKWGTASNSVTNNSGTTRTTTTGTIRTTTTGTNTLYYSCVAGSGNTESAPITGSWSYTGVLVATNGTIMQTITTATCPTTRIRANDARDNRSYYVQKLGDDKCWMLTNLAYAGGGTATYNDTKTLTATTSTSGSFTYTTSSVHTSPGGAAVTSGSTNPSTTTGSGGQYGYLYNWCAAMGAQTSACNNTSTTGFDTTISICPAGWHLPTSTEFTALNTAVNSGSTSSDSGLLSTWLGVYSGLYSSGLLNQGSNGLYWSSTVYDATTARGLYFYSSRVNPSDGNRKYSGFAVRCVAAS